MRKILYLSPVDWDWIKQRPQFLAEALSVAYEVHVLYRKQFNRRGLRRSASERDVLLHSYRTLPSACNRSRTLASVNAWIGKKSFEKALKQVKPDWIWLTHPSQFAFLVGEPSAKLVYDCMDDYLLLGCADKLRDELTERERLLCDQAELVFASSFELMKRLERRYGLKQKLYLIRNGCCAAETPVRTEPAAEQKKRFRLVYFGTISDWFDFDLLRLSLERFPCIEYELVGPMQAKKAFSHERIRYCGSVPHEELRGCAEKADCLIMPFLKTGMIEAVDPVKMYEYISFRRNILCLSYSETQRFRPFASLYSGAEEYLEKLGALLKDNRLKYSNEQAEAFLAENSWRQRAGQIVELMKEYNNQV